MDKKYCKTIQFGVNGEVYYIKDAEAAEAIIQLTQALQEAVGTIAEMQETIADHEARIEALEQVGPTPPTPTPEHEYDENTGNMRFSNIAVISYENGELLLNGSIIEA